jgi:hypothetical protein
MKTATFNQQRAAPAAQPAALAAVGETRRLQELKCMPTDFPAEALQKAG